MIGCIFRILTHDAKCGESFTVIMKYVYGLDINFSQLKINVLCEAINLAEVYQLEKFSNDLKGFLSKVDKFQLDSLAVLLNTSRKYNLNELYEKLKVYTFEHAADFVKHESIVNLQYEVLLNLVKSDWFCAPEIDILMGVLNWHHRMSTKDAKETLENNVQNEDINDDASSVASDHSATNTVLQSNDKGNTGEDNQDVDYEGVTVEDETHVESADHSTNSGAVMSIPDSLSVLVKLFNENVLKSLLLHVRVKQSTMFEQIKLSETNFFEKYKHDLGFEPTPSLPGGSLGH
uniref:BTB/POZ domain-containing protein 9 n=1 Tax=Cacopsylla melanoneura TaxID=428564 RepID=A0A8D8YSI2_9HEMI